jgi:N utilization substance protein B
MARRFRAREVALQLLFERDHNAKTEQPQIEGFVQGRIREEELRQFCLRLYKGVLEHQVEIDRRISEAADNWRLERIATVDRNALRLGAFELLHCHDTPPAVVFDEAIELARRYGSADSPAFVNGVLDRLRRGITPAESSADPQSPIA